MNGFYKFLAAAFLSAAMLFAGAAQAMTIQQFDKIAGPEQDKYIAELVQAAEKALMDAGRSNDAARVSKLFTTNAPDSKESIGMNRFYVALALVRADDAKHGEQSDVAVAMALAMETAGIELPDNFIKLAANIKPGSSPPKAKEKKEKKN